MPMHYGPTIGRRIAGFYAASVVIATRAAIQGADSEIETARPRLIDRLRDAGRRVVRRLRRLGKGARARRIPVTMSSRQLTA